jgi:hypothetical protein
MLRAVRRRLLPALAIAALLPGCAEDPAARQRRTEARVIRRQIGNLREITAAARERRLIDPRWLAVAVDESAVKLLLQAGLPQETVIGDRFRVRVDTAAVSFRGGAGLLSFQALVADQQRGVQAIVVYHGGLDDITVGADGRLRTRALIDDVEIPAAQAEGTDATQIARVADLLAGANLQALQDRIPALEIPVRLQQSVAVEGLHEGPVQVAGGEVPVTATVARVLPLSGRLWVFLDVKAGTWRPAATETRP